MFNFCDEHIIKIYVTFEELYIAYIDCRKRKRSTYNCEAFEINEYENLYQLWIELNTFTYRIGRSVTFIYHDPESNKYREIFAADFRDRIVQHLIVNRILSIFEYIWNDRSFSCRKGKGTDYGVKCLYNDIKEASDNYTKQCYIAQFDIYSFFASLNKDILFNFIKNLIIENYELLNCENSTKYDVIFTLYLIRKIIYNDPRHNCIYKQPKSFWNNMPKHKSAFFLPKDQYLAVGNVTSQMFANILLSNLDKILVNNIQYHGRYVDDIYDIVFSIKEFHIVENTIENVLHSIGLKLQNKKTHIQPYQNGVKFVGKYIKKNRIYVLNKTKGKFIRRINYFNEYWKHNSINVIELHYIVNVINSFLGILNNCTAYKLKTDILRINSFKCLGKYCYVKYDKNKEKYVLKIKKKYKIKY